MKLSHIHEDRGNHLGREEGYAGKKEDRQNCRVGINDEIL
jgi:hypothetical protein